MYLAYWVPSLTLPHTHTIPPHPLTHSPTPPHPHAHHPLTPHVLIHMYSLHTPLTLTYPFTHTPYCLTPIYSHPLTHTPYCLTHTHIPLTHTILPHSHSHPFTLTPSHPPHTHSHPLTLAPTHTPSHSYPHPLSHSHFTNLLSLSSCTRTQWLHNTYTQSQIHAHSYTPTHTHTHTRTHTYTHRNVCNSCGEGVCHR